MSVRYPILSVSLLACLSFSQFVGAQSIVNSFSAPGTNARGLAWDGTYLWCADALGDKVYKLNASNGSILSSFSFSINSNYGGLTWSVTDKIWIGNGLYIYQVNPTTGGTVSSFHCPGS